MRAKDVMTADVVTIGPDTDVRAIAQILLERCVSAVPVVDQAGQVVGIVSEGDLMRRVEAGTERRSSWWLELLAGPRGRAFDFAKSHGRTAKDVMTRAVVTVSEETSLGEIANLLEEHRIKRVPVMRDRIVVGVVSRANLLHGLVAKEAAPEPTVDDADIRKRVLSGIKEAGITDPYLNVVVAGGIVHVWGFVGSEAEKDAIRIAAETAPGVKEVRSHVRVGASPAMSGGWA
jgi:CBS domain-containing protein